MKVIRFVLTAALAMSLATAAFSQDIANAESRKLTKRVAPNYPELAKRMGVAGAVKLEIAVAADGKVKDVKVLGGHPVLAQAAAQSAHNWQFEPGRESTEQVTVNFTR